MSGPNKGNCGVHRFTFCVVKRASWEFRETEESHSTWTAVILIILLKQYVCCVLLIYTEPVWVVKLFSRCEFKGVKFPLKQMRMAYTKILRLWEYNHLLNGYKLWHLNRNWLFLFLWFVVFFGSVLGFWEGFFVVLELFVFCFFNELLELMLHY